MHLTFHHAFQRLDLGLALNVISFWAGQSRVGMAFLGRSWRFGHARPATHAVNFSISMQAQL
jgi:hypothetical protein